MSVFGFSGSPASCYFIFYICSINLYCTLANKYDDDGGFQNIRFFYTGAVCAIGVAFLSIRLTRLVSINK